MNISSYTIILFGAIFTFLHGLEQITGRIKNRTLGYITAIVMADVALILYNHAILSTDYVVTHRAVLVFYLTSIYAIGPLNFLYYYSLINNDITISHRLLFHLLPAAIVFLIELLYYLLPQYAHEQFITTVYANIINPFSILLFTGGLSFILYQIYFVYQCCKAFNYSYQQKGIFFVLALETINILTPLPVVLWLLTKQHHYYAIAGYMTTIVIVSLFLTNRRFPSLFDSIAEAIRKEKYERNYLSNINQELLHNQLLTLMTHEKVYLDPDISLHELSLKLKITPHQLSQFINEHCNMRFNHFINKYRVEEAKHLLSQHPDATILAVAYHVGFNSKSTFNKTFKQYTGQTPSDYKKNYL